MNDSADAVEQRIQSYLDDVSTVLRAEGVGSDDIESVCDGLRAQAFEIAEQSGAVTENSIAQAIASMDDPEHFATAMDQLSDVSALAKAHSTDYEPARRLASISFYTAIAGPAIALLSGILASFAGKDGWEFGSSILFTVAIVALVFGAISRKEPRGRAAMLLSLGTVAGYFVLVLVALIFS